MDKLRVSTIVRRQFFSVMVVMTMVELANAASMADGMMAGRLLGPTELAAFGIAVPYYRVGVTVKTAQTRMNTGFLTCHFAL